MLKSVVYIRVSFQPFSLVDFVFQQTSLDAPLAALDFIVSLSVVVLFCK